MVRKMLSGMREMYDTLSSVELSQSDSMMILSTLYSSQPPSPLKCRISLMRALLHSAMADSWSTTGLCVSAWPMW